MPIDLAVNVGVPDGPKGSASSTLTPEGVAQAIDGRMWFFPENVNGWSPIAGEAESWYQVDLGKPRRVGSVELYFSADDAGFQAPAAYRVEVKSRDGWKEVAAQRHTPAAPLAGGENRIVFPAATTNAIRIVFEKPAAPANFRLIELKAFGPQ